MVGLREFKKSRPSKEVALRVTKFGRQKKYIRSKIDNFDSNCTENLHFSIFAIRDVFLQHKNERFTNRHALILRKITFVKSGHTENFKFYRHDG